MDGGRWTVDGGRWTVDGGRWTVDGGRWTVDGGRWTVDGGVDGGRWDGGRQKRTPSAPVTVGNNTRCMTLKSTSPFIKWNHSVHYTYYTYSYHTRQALKPTAGIDGEEPRFPCPLCSDIRYR